MRDALNKIARKAGVDKAIAYTILARVIQAGGGVMSILFTAHYLDKVEQGYYYTFGSILAIQIFFELGLSNIITQFAAYEVAHLKWDSKITLSGEDKALSRLSSLLRFCVKWFAAFSVILLVVLIITGIIFFSKYGKGEAVNWQAPWIILSVSSACSLVISPILAYFEGLGKISEIAKIRLAQQICQLIALLGFLVLGFKLYASPLAAFLTFIVALISLAFSYRKELLRFIWQQQKEWIVNYRHEILPFQWRIAVSWIGGYFIFQLFNPVLFVTEGPVVAGQMGMTLAALNGIIALPMSWFSTKVPLFSSLIAKREFTTLDNIFYRTLKQAGALCAFCIIFFILVTCGLRMYYPKLGLRFLPFTPTLLLSIALFVNQFVGSIATYLRCHKKEPFLILTVIMAACCALSTFGFGHLFGVMGITAGYCALVIFLSLPFSLWIYVTKKREWHQEIAVD